MVRCLAARVLLKFSCRVIAKSRAVAELKRAGELIAKLQKAAMFTHVCVVRLQWFLSINLIDQCTSSVFETQVLMLASGEQVRGSG